MSNIVYLEVASRRTVAEMGGWDRRRHIGLSIAATLSGEDLQIYTEAGIAKLAGVLEAADQVIGYNLRELDLEILAGYPVFAGKVVRAFDLLEAVQQSSGKRLPLQSLTAATLGDAPVFDCVDLVRLWKAGDTAAVIETCRENAIRIKALHEFGCEHGMLFYFSDAEGTRRVPIPVEFPSG